MSPTLFVGLVAFAFASSITPGPNNLMLMASGAVHGLKRTAPHMAGVILGFGAMTIAVGLGAAGIFRVAPWLYSVLRWGAAAYILYLAYRLATAKGAGTGTASVNPMSFWGAVGFQWINPKAWVMGLGAVTTYAEQSRFVIDVLTIGAVMMVVTVPSTLIWTVFGVNIRRWLKSPLHLKLFNWSMAALLVASLYPLITEPLGPKPAGAQAPQAASSAHR